MKAENRETAACLSCQAALELNENVHSNPILLEQMLLNILQSLTKDNKKKTAFKISMRTISYSNKMSMDFTQVYIWVMIRTSSQTNGQASDVMWEI